MATGYGIDVWCLDAIRTGRLAYGSTIVAQNQYHRLVTPRGTLRGGEEESAYGFDVAGYVGHVGHVGSELALRALPAQIRAELLKDDRVSNVVVEASITTDPDGTSSIVLAVTSTLADETGDFTLTLAVTAVSVTILGLA